MEPDLDNASVGKGISIIFLTYADGMGLIFLQEENVCWMK